VKVGKGDFCNCDHFSPVRPTPVASPERV
jgi:hypothetical protein